MCDRPIHICTCICSAIEQFARAKYDLNLKKDDGFAAIHLAALNDHLDVITALAEMVHVSLAKYMHNRVTSPY